MMNQSVEIAQKANLVNNPDLVGNAHPTTWEYSSFSRYVAQGKYSEGRVNVRGVPQKFLIFPTLSIMWVSRVGIAHN
jgi:hypothetical protein